MSHVWNRLSTFWRVALIVLAALIVIWAIGFVVLGWSQATT